MARKYYLRRYPPLQMLRVRADGTRCYLTKETGKLDTMGTPKEFLSVADAERAFYAVAPPGWKHVIEEVPMRLGVYGTGRLSSQSHGQDFHQVLQ